MAASTLRTFRESRGTDGRASADGARCSKAQRAHFAGAAPERDRGGLSAAPHEARGFAARMDAPAPQFAASATAVDRSPSDRGGSG